MAREIRREVEDMRRHFDSWTLICTFNSHKYEKGLHQSAFLVEIRLTIYS